MCFQIEKMCCGSEVIASQSWKSSKKRMFMRWRCDVEVLRPQSCKEMHATAWRASLHHISTSYAKKRRKFQRLPFLGTRHVHPHSDPKISQWSCVCSRSVTPPILQRNARNCLASIMASHFNFTCKEKMKVSTPAVFGHPPCAPTQ